MYKIMIADDEGIVIDALKFIIEKSFGETCQVQSAKTGRSVIELAESFRPDIALMDIQMPKMNGYKATQAIRNLPDKDKACIPIVAMTANAFTEDRLKAKEAGMNDHVAKPVDMSILISVIAKYIER